MAVVMSKDEMRIRLEKDLEEFDKIILVDEHRVKQEFLEAFYESEALTAVCKKILILSGTEDKRKGNIVWRHITESEVQDIIKLYRMYEFSNRIVLLSWENAFGGLENLVNTGVLTQEEAITAFLYEI